MASIEFEHQRDQTFAFDTVHNFCAKHGLVPVVKVFEERNPLNPRADPTHFTLQVQLPEQKISVAVRASVEDRHLQEEVAFIHFNKELQESGLLKISKSSQALITSPSLSLTNAEEFVRFSRPGTEISLAQKRRDRYKRVQIRLDGVTTGTGCSVSTTQATQAAWLVTAVNIAKTSPNLLGRFFDSPGAGLIAIASNPTAPIQPEAVEDDSIKDDIIEDDPVAVCGIEYESIENGSVKDAATSDNGPAAPTSTWPIEIDLGPRNRDLIKKALIAMGVAYNPIKYKELGSDHQSLGGRSRAETRAVYQSQLDLRSEQLLNSYREYNEREDLENLREARAKLPISIYADRILNLVSESPFSIIVGATGSGKTTQVPQIILDNCTRSREGAECNIVCTQPRIMAAISVAKRVANERAQEIGDQIGHHVRFDAKLPIRGGSITYCTTGVLLRQLLYSPDILLDTISHLIIDEVHVRDSYIDFTLAVLKNAVLERMRSGKKVPRVILMSATIDSSMFASYLEINDLVRGTIKCPILDVPGRTFPVEEIYLEEFMKNLNSMHGEDAVQPIYQEHTTRLYLESEARLSNMSLPAVLGTKRDLKPRDAGVVRLDSRQVPLALVVACVAHIVATSKSGAILVFLPGLEILLKALTMLEGQTLLGVNFQDRRKYRFYLLHSTLSDNQRAVFENLPEGCRKIILATNIAETSITIPEVQFVVDAGKYREFSYDLRTQMSTLLPSWISRSSSKQRAGRAGRVQDGRYYALFPKSRQLLATGVPDLLRIDLQEICLAVKGHGVKSSIRDFLSQAITPPSDAAIGAAVAKLVALGALTKREEITPMGYLLNRLPLQPLEGKMVLLGIIYKCLDPMLILASSIQHPGLFINPINDREDADAKRIEAAGDSRSDHIALINAFYALRRILMDHSRHRMEAYARKLFLSPITFTNIAGTALQIESLLEKEDAIPSNFSRRGVLYGTPGLNENSDKEALLKAIIAACLPIAVRRTPNLYTTPGHNATVVHPISVNETFSKPRSERPLWPLRQRLLAYTSLSQTGSDDSAFLRGTTEVTPLATALFGRDLAVQSTPTNSKPADTLIVDNCIRMRVLSSRRSAPSPAHQLLDLHAALRKMENEAYVLLSKRRFMDRKAGLVRDAVVRDIVQLLEQDAYDAEMAALEKELMVSTETSLEDEINARMTKAAKADAPPRERFEGEAARLQEEDEEQRALYEENQEMLALVVSEWRRKRGELEKERSV